ncbi:MAG: hypothetical protein ACI4U9_03275 [Clostridia bacterium]
MRVKYTVNDAIKELVNYVRDDRLLRNNRTETDFEKFCEGHCSAIETVLIELEALRKEK